MTYDTYEQSIASGEPTELYDFLDNISGEHWRINTTEDTITYGSYDYSPGIVDRETINRTGNLYEDTLNVKLERGHDLSNMFISGTPEGEVTLNIYRGHVADGNYIIIWMGFVDSCEYDEDGIPLLRCLPRTSRNSGVGKRRRCQRLCDHSLYSYGCNVNQESYRVDGTIVNLSGTTITSSVFAGYSDGWFTGGKIIIEEQVIRFIRSHTTNTISVNRIMLNTEIGDTFRAYAGCNKLATTCNTKFGNKLNFGGEEFLPEVNPFGASMDTLSVPLHPKQKMIQ